VLLGYGAIARERIEEGLSLLGRALRAGRR
jgi:hypothetical protein